MQIVSSTFNHFAAMLNGRKRGSTGSRTPPEPFPRIGVAVVAPQARLRSGVKLRGSFRRGEARFKFRDRVVLATASLLRAPQIHLTLGH